MVNLLYFVLSIYIIFNIVEPKISEINTILKKDSIIENRIKQEEYLLNNRDEIITKLKEKEILIRNFDKGFFETSLLDAICISKADLALKKIATQLGIKDIKISLPKESINNDNIKTYSFEINFISSKNELKNFIELLQNDDIYFYIGNLEFLKNEKGTRIRLFVSAYQLVEGKK